MKFSTWPENSMNLNLKIVNTVPKKNDVQISGNKAEALKGLYNKLEKFDKFPFKAYAKNLVFSDGNADADLMLIGEAPGEDEDKEGKPFVGRSGKLLSSFLETLGFDRSKYYITNIINWRPPGNRTPTPEEIELAKPFVIEHIQIIKPKLIITVGSVALKALGITQGITMAQGKLFEVELAGKVYRVFPVYHPSYALRMPSKKRDLWLSLLKMEEELAKIK